jgi:hypothetical protein
MMRYRGKFSRSAYPDIVIHPSDEGEVLEEKWKKWYQLESWKRYADRFHERDEADTSRLAFHAYLRDAQISMTQLNNPSMSYAEMTLPLPCSKELWFARTAEEFKARYLESSASKRPPSLGDLFRDINALTANHDHIDLQFAIAIYLHGLWSLVWEYRQIASIHTHSPASPSTTPSSASVLLSSRRDDLLHQLTTFHTVITQHAQTSKTEILPESHLLLHVLFLNLHVSLPGLHIFTGKEGEDQARRVYPALQRWAASKDARQAMWHAAQAFRWARVFSRGRLRAFWGVGICHAALVVWTYGVVNRAGAETAGRHQMQVAQHQVPQQVHQVQQHQGYQHQAQQHQQQHGQTQGAQQHRQAGMVYLDGEDTPEVRAWVEYGQGRPAIHGLGHAPSGGDGGRGRECLLEDPPACMEVAQEILRANFVGVWESLPAMSEKSIVLLKQLEKAARAVGMG